MNAGEAYAPVAVIFDLGGVVLESPLQFIAQFERDHGLPAGLIARLVGGYGQTTGPNHWHALERGEVSTHDFLELFAAVALAVLSFNAAFAQVDEPPPDPKMTWAICVVSHYKKGGDPRERWAAALDKLSGVGVRQVILAM